MLVSPGMGGKHPRKAAQARHPCTCFDFFQEIEAPIYSVTSRGIKKNYVKGKAGARQDHGFQETGGFDYNAP